MKKKPRRNKSTVHPSPPPQPNQNLSCLSAALQAQAADLSPEDREALAYILQHGIRTNDESYRIAAGNHAPRFWCDCYNCYSAFSRRWHSSPNNDLMDEIILADEARDGKLKKPPESEPEAKAKVSSSRSEPDRPRGESGEAEAEASRGAGKKKKKKSKQKGGDGNGVVLGSESEERVAAVSSSGDESEPRGEEACSQVRKIARSFFKGFLGFGLG